VNAIRFDAPAGLFTAQSTPLPLEINISGFAGFSADYLFRSRFAGNTLLQ